MDFEAKKIPADVQKTLDYYGASLDESGEPDEAPEDESVVTLPTQEEEERTQRNGPRRSAHGVRKGVSVHDFSESAREPRRAC